MAKKPGNKSQQGRKKASTQKKNVRDAGRSYSLDDILDEYRASPEAGPPAPSLPRENGESPRQRQREAVSELAEDMRSEQKAREKTLPEPEAAPVRSEEDGHPRKKKQPAKGKEKKAPAETPHKSEKAPPRGNYQVGGNKKGPFHKLYGWFLGQAAVIAIKKRMKAAMQEEDAEIEQEPTPLEAAKVYASQLPAFLRRSRSAALLSLLCIWIALAWGADIPIPGALGTDVLTATLVSLILLLTVMLMGLDVLTVGILSLFGKKPGLETLLSLGCLASVADCVSVVLSKNAAAPLPPCAVCCAGITLALRGSWYRCRSLKSAFLTLHKNKNVYTVNGEKLPAKEGKYLIKSHRGTAGFIRAGEEPDICELTGQQSALPVLLLTVLLSGVAAFINGFSTLPHCLAVLSSLSCCWAAFVTLPMLLSPVNERLAKEGAALSGWRAVDELGGCQHLIITDSDLFPEGTTAFNSIRILDGQDTEQVIARTGSLLAVSGTDLARLFGDLMERSGARTVPILDFEPENGGASGLIDGVQVQVGNAGYMYYIGVKIDPKLVGDTVIYTAYDKELVGAFGVEYTPDPKVATALRTLKRGGQRPVFAPKDFNIDAQLVERLFRCKTDGFDFPDPAGREQLYAATLKGNVIPAAIVSAGGLDVIADIFDTSHYLSRCGRILRLLCLFSTALGLGLGFLFCLRGAWAVVSATRLLLYMLFWLLPGLAMSVRNGM